MTLLTSQTSPRDIQADAIVIGVVQAGGPQPAPGSGDVDQALDGGLATTLSVLGATGRAEEITKIAAAGRLTAPLIVAVGIGPVQARRATGRRSAAPGGLPPRCARCEPAAKPAARWRWRCRPATTRRPEAVGLGALLGGYVFSRYRAKRAPANDRTHHPRRRQRRRRAACPDPRRRGHARARPGEHRPLAPVSGGLRGRGRAHPAAAGSTSRYWTNARWPTAATAASPASGRARSVRRGSSGWLTPSGATRPLSSRGRASRSTRAVSR